MKIIAILIALASVVALRSNAQDLPTKYAGKVTIERLGTIAFPAGEWALEIRRLEPDAPSNYRPNYFVFKKLGAQLERLTFLRYGPTADARPINSFLDTTRETLGDGIPADHKKYRPPAGELLYPMRLEPTSPKSTDTRISYSFIHVHPTPQPSWLCHTLLFSRSGAVFIVAHASTSVTNPAIIEDLHFQSTFSPDAISAPASK